MKVFFASAICLIVLVQQIAAVEITHTESESESLKEHLNIKIHQKETIRPVDSPCPFKFNEKVFVNNGKPIIVTGKSRHVVIPASKPIVVKPSPVLIRQKGDVEIRPIHITKQRPPLIVTKKIVKLHQPIIKKYYVEKYRRQEDGGPAHIVSQRVSKQTCNCPVSEHLIDSKYNFNDPSVKVAEVNFEA
ncbi:uncharacterized protein LOC119076489 [Bradysia coprophila]|uniref:uncharacterized protein LOC119076489 n=1 Tax=Bradysia coprophila TaxID=38358 RepID=UPI00187DBDD9|nr:uncharacterized protein LOC119076489 [Bradysia coprophila]